MSTSFEDLVQESRAAIAVRSDVAWSDDDAVLVAVRARGQRHRQRMQLGAAVVAAVVVLVGGGALAVASSGRESATLDVGGGPASSSRLDGDGAGRRGVGTVAPDDGEPGTSTTDGSTDGTTDGTSGATTTSKVGTSTTAGPSTTRRSTTTTGRTPSTTARSGPGPTAPAPPDPEPTTTSSDPPTPTTLHAPPPGPAPEPLPGEVVEPPQAAYTRWRANVPSRYTMRVRQYMGGGWQGPVDVSVVGNRVVAVVDANTGASVTSTILTIEDTYNYMLGEFGTSGCNCVSTAVATGLPVDGVFSWFQVTNNAGDQLMFRIEVSGFWLD